MGPVVHFHAFSVLQVAVEGDVQMLILRDFILATTCLEAKDTGVDKNELVFYIFLLSD